ncbi:MAG: hypothetical protein ACXVGE_13090 [Blastococcus sp.]
MRRLDEVTRQLGDLIKTLESNYVRKDVNSVQLTALEKEVHDVRHDMDAIVDQQRQNRRLAVTGLLLPILVGIITALILSAVIHP